MRASFAPIAVPGRNPSVLITLGLEQPSVTERTEFDVAVQTNAYLPDGRPRLIGARHAARVVLVPSKGDSKPRYDLLTEISLPPGRYEIRMSAHRGLDNVSGSLYADVDVPDFENDELSVSGLFLEMEPADPSAPRGAFSRLLPIVPTSNREFRRGDATVVYMRVYQGAMADLLPVTIATRLVDERDKQVGEGRDRIEVSAFKTAAGRSADYRFPIPLSYLPPGRYLLTLDVSVGPVKTSRSLQFTVVAK
jgi:hypothetical protein